MEIIARREPCKEFKPGEENITLFKKMRATVCHHCPLCCHARKNPHSRIGRIFHKYHADHCPMWQAEKEVYRKGEEMESPDVKAHMLWKAL